jgi:dTDP-4-amino-4,6-dideoxygalactose transaminase
MYISLNPIFRISQGFRILDHSAFMGFPWKTKPDDKVVSFSRGRWALAQLALNLMRSKRKTGGMVFVPEYFCELSLTPLRNLNYQLHFYKITSRFEPNVDHLDTLVRKWGTPDILLYVHYFGFPSRIKITGDWCKKNGVMLVEDAAHTIVPIPGIGDNGYPTIFAPWKYFNTLEGAIIVLPQQMINLMSEPDNQNSEAKYPWVWIAKKIIQAMAAHFVLPLHRIRAIYVKKEDESERVPDIKNPFCNPFFEKILSYLAGEIERVAEIRQRNYCLIDRLLIGTDSPAQRLFSTLPAKFGPYLYPLRVRDGKCRVIMIALNHKGIPALPWSDLSPEVLSSVEYPLANALRREILTLPIHQDLKEDQINWMVKELASELCNTH